VPNADQRPAFLTRQQELSDNPPWFIAELLDFLENPTNIMKADEGHNSDKELHIKEQGRQEHQVSEAKPPEVNDPEIHNRKI
jgi:hypothetical protein